MNILVCIKRVPGPGSAIILTHDAQAIDTTHLGFTIGPHEECAVEEAVQIVARERTQGGERSGGTVTALTVGPPEHADQLRFAISMGADDGVLVDPGVEEPDPQATAGAIVEAIDTLESENGPFDLILFGNESADAGNYQVGMRVAYALRRPIVGGVKGIEFDGLDGATVRLSCDRGDGMDVYEAPLPAVAAVKEGLNLPRYPTMRGRLKAAKAPLRTVETQPAAGGLRKLRLRHPVEERVETVMLGTGPEAAEPVVDVLEELGVV